MVLLITGASSYLGARLYVDLAEKDKVIGTFNTHKLFLGLERLDVTDRVAVEKLVKKHLPDAIVHVAAMPSPSQCEKDPEKARTINELGTKHVVDAANATKAKVVFISSDEALSPSNTYGASKLAGEALVARAKYGYVIIRPSIILGFSPNTASDRPFNRFLRNIEGKTPAAYDNARKYQPTWAGHISEVIWGATEKGIENEQINVAVPEAKTRFEMARDVLEPFGVPVTAIEQDTGKTIKLDLAWLKRLGLPQYGYGDLVEKVVDEIRHRERFSLPMKPKK